jgi:hypothetical protein
MGKLIPSCNYGGICVICDKPYQKGDPIWWIASRQASHPECQHLEREYIFASTNGTELLDRLTFVKPGDMLTKAFELSVENNKPVGVSRIDHGKTVSLFMISALAGASLVPAPEPEPEEITGPLFEWTGDGLPF